MMSTRLREESMLALRKQADEIEGWAQSIRDVTKPGPAGPQIVGYAVWVWPHGYAQANGQPTVDPDKALVVPTEGKARALLLDARWNVARVVSMAARGSWQGWHTVDVGPYAGAQSEPDRTHSGALAHVKAALLHLRWAFEEPGGSGLSANERADLEAAQRHLAKAQQSLQERRDAGRQP